MNDELESAHIDKMISPDEYYEALWRDFEAGRLTRQTDEIEKRTPQRPYYDRTDYNLRNLVRKERRNESYIPDHSSSRMRLRGALHQMRTRGYSLEQ